MRPGTFAVHYQPVLDLATVRAARRQGGPALAEGTRWVEALVRWPAQDGSLLAPDERGAPSLDDRVTDSAVEIALHHAVRWRARSMDFPMAVNLSPSQLLRPDAARHLAGIADAARARRDDLIVEVPAGELDPERGGQARRAVGDLCEYGFRIALDGVSLAARDVMRLAGLPAQFLKVHRSLVAAAPHDRAAAAAVEAQAAFARSAGMIPLAVGIETEAQLELVAGLGYGLGQGFLLSRPLTAAEVTVFCRPLSPEPVGAEAVRRRLLSAG